MSEHTALARPENEGSYAHVQNVREAIRVLMQTEGIDALGSAHECPAQDADHREQKQSTKILFKTLRGVTTGLLSLPLVLVMLSPAIASHRAGITSSSEGTSAIGNTVSTDEFDAEILEDSTSGKWGTCVWELDDDGTLWVHAGIGEDGRADESPWSGVANRVLKIRFDDGVTFPETSWYLFYGFPLVEEIDLGPCDLSNVSDATQMFSDCISLRTATFGDWHANKVTK